MITALFIIIGIIVYLAIGISYIQYIENIENPKNSDEYLERDASDKMALGMFVMFWPMIFIAETLGKFIR